MIRAHVSVINTKQQTQNQNLRKQKGEERNEVV
jgi:hypothetical protein